MKKILKSVKLKFRIAKYFELRFLNLDLLLTFLSYVYISVDLSRMEAVLAL